MSASSVDTDLVARICREATARNGNGNGSGNGSGSGSGSGSVMDVVRDPLDGTIWVRLSSWPQAGEALRALNAHGISGHDLEDGRLRVTGWNVPLLRRRLGVLLAGVDDLKTEWDATAELVCYHHDRRVAAGIDPDPAEVLADVETAMRSCLPIPHRAPRVQDIDSLLQLITAAEDAYQQLIAEHIDYAERVLAADISGRHHGSHP